MIPVYQKIVETGKGDCMRAVICSLIGEPDIETVPNFIEFNSWYEEMHRFLKDRGFKLHGGGLINKYYTMLTNPSGSCFKEIKWHKPSLLNRTNIKKLEGIDGFLWGSVLSPKFITAKNGYFNTHAVVIDKELNIVHDPNPEYKGILEYPLSKMLKYNGIYDVTNITRI